MAQNEVGKPNPFDPESMAQEFHVAGKRLIMKPLSVLQVAKLLEILEVAVEGIDPQKPETIRLSTLTNDMTRKAKKCIHLVFPNETHGFLTDEFIESNFTIPMFKKMSTAFIRMNNLESLLPHLLFDAGE